MTSKTPIATARLENNPVSFAARAFGRVLFAFLPAVLFVAAPVVVSVALGSWWPGWYYILPHSQDFNPTSYWAIIANLVLVEHQPSPHS